MELVQDETLRKDLRHAMETQFRYKLYHDASFPFLHSLGIKDIIQGFANDEVGLVGILHLHYTTEKGKIGLWKSTWYDTEEEGTQAGQAIVDASCFDAEKVTLMLIREQLSKIKSVEEPEVPDWQAEINTDKVLLN
tara:strand:+ start:351 stop:758 length:408 start_codon:yes stop_codon:yes gene_type:complete